MQAQSVSPTIPTIVDYHAQLNNLRQQEDELFQLALSNPQEAHLTQFEAIWSQRNAIHQLIETAMTPMPIEPAKTQESIYCTVKEIQAIPKLNWYQMELWGKKEWQPESQSYLCKKGVKLPESIVQQYELAPRQIAILQQEITLEGLEEEVGNEDKPCWCDAAHLASDKDYGYTSRDIIMGRY